jgi:hypothetical protein
MTDSAQLTPLAAALIGAGGVIIGGSLTTLSNVWLDGRRAEREALAARESDRRDLRLAVRLVIEELADSEQLVREAASAGQYWAAPRVLSADVWTQYRTVLAQSIESPFEWRVITLAFDEGNRLNWIVGTRGSQHSPSRFREAERVDESDDVRRAWRAMRAGIRTLEHLIQVQGPASRMLRSDEEIEREVWDHS